MNDAFGSSRLNTDPSVHSQALFRIVSLSASSGFLIGSSMHARLKPEPRAEPPRPRNFAPPPAAVCQCATLCAGSKRLELAPITSLDHTPHFSAMLRASRDCAFANV